MKVITFAKLLLCAALAASGGFAATASAHGQQHAERGLMITIKYDSRDQIKNIRDAGYDIAGINLGDKTLDIILDNTNSISQFEDVVHAEIVKQVTLDPKLAPDSQYKTPAEIREILTQYAADYPNLTKLEVIGQTTEGRDIMALKITDNPEERELDESTILFNGMHHAREIMTPEVVLDTADYLLTNYGTDAKVTDWVDNTEVWLVPQVNPDGNNKVWNGSSMWRKNMGANGNGVDINRNYPFMWGACNGSSGSEWSDTYRGPSAGSEPETQALMGLVARTQPVFDISYHSYSELVLYPFGCSGQRTPTKEVVEGIGIEMAGMLAKDGRSGTYEPGTPWDILYSVDGGDIDWMYNEYNVIPYVIELNSSNDGFQPPYSKRQPTVEKMRPAWGMLLDRLSGSGVRGIVRDGSGRVNPSAKVTVENLGDNSMVSNTTNVKADGTYHLILVPGMYRLTFMQNGQMFETEVTVGDTRVDVDVTLGVIGH